MTSGTSRRQFDTQGQIPLNRPTRRLRAVTIGVTSFFGSFLYFYALERSSPHTAVSITRQTFELSDHGYLFYVTREQYWLFQVLSWGGWCLAALGAILNYRWKVIHNLTPHGWELPK